MGIFNTLRVKMGSLLIILIGLSILAFLVGDLLGPNSVLLGNGKQTVGQIAGTDISLERYQNKLEEFKNNFRASSGRTPSESELNSLRQQAWDYMIVEVAFQQQYDELGLEVTDAELVDMVQGDNISPLIKNAFSNPETGEFDKERAIQTIKSFAQASPAEQAQWIRFEANLVPARARAKYDALIEATSYITDAEAKRAYQRENESLEVEYLYVPLSTIADSAVNPTESELRAYFDDNIDQYKTDASRTLSYIKFDITPSKEDSLYLRKEMEDLKVDFIEANDDSAFARSHTDRAMAFNAYAISELPKILGSNVNITKEGDVLGPYIENGAYVLYKVSKIYDADTKSVKASHILIKTGDDIDEAEAKKKAQDVLAKAKAGQDFAELAKEYSEGPTAIKGGDLGWFKEGAMVSEFNEAVFAKNGTGVINEIVKTQYGFHIIKVTEEATAKTYDIATIERDILPSEETRDQAFRKADYFAATNTNYTEFTDAAEKEGYKVATTGKMNKNQRSIAGMENTRQIVRWAFTEASVNQVSEVYEAPEAYVVSVLTDKSDDEEANFEASKLIVTRSVKREKKAEMIKNKLSEMMSDDLNAIASAYGEEARLNSKEDLKLTDNSLPSVGQAPEVIGTAFGLEVNKVSKPLRANNGIVIIKVINKTPASEIADYSAYKEQLAQQLGGNASFKIKTAIEDKAEIEDNRYKFF